MNRVLASLLAVCTLCVLCALFAIPTAVEPMKPHAGESVVAGSVSRGADVDDGGTAHAGANATASANPGDSGVAHADANGAAISGASHGDAASAPYEPGALLATLAPGVTTEQLAAELAADPAFSGISLGEVITDTVVKLSLPESASVEQAAQTLAHASSIASAQPNRRLYTQQSAGLVAATIASVQSALVNDPAYLNGLQWGLDSIGAPGAWESASAEVAEAAKAAGTASAQPVTIAVIDAGFYVDHEDLDGNIAAQYDATVDPDDPGASSIEPDNPVKSEIDHGTHAAGTVAARTNNATGIAGVGFNLCRVLPIRIQNSKGDIYESYVVRAYDYILAHAAELNIRVVNMSLGAASSAPVTTQYSSMHDAIDDARAAGIVTVVAACNDYTRGKNAEGNTVYFHPPFYAYPSDFESVVSVINLDQSGSEDDNGVERSSSSNYNVEGQRAKNISAPGTAAYGLYGSADEDGHDRYGYKSGTSMAAPVVAGTLGLMFSANPALTADQAVRALYESARDLTQGDHMSAGWDEGSGYGEVDADAAVAAALDPKTCDISDCAIELSATSFTYNGKARKPSVKPLSVTIDGEQHTLVEGVDYELTNPGVVKGKGKVTVTGLGRYTGSTSATYTVAVKKTPVYQLYNKKTKQWFYTASATKRTAKLKAGWVAKGVAWKAPSKSTTPVYYKKSSGKVLYTTKKTSLGIAFYGYGYKTKPVYRYYNAKTKAYRYSTKKITSSGFKRKATLFYAV